MPPRQAAAGTRALTPLGGSAAKRQKGAAAGPGAAEGGTRAPPTARKTPAGMAGAAKAPPPDTRPATLDESEEDEEGAEGEMDLATLQAMMVEVVRKRKQAAQRKQAAMIAELEAEAAAALEAKRKEVEGGQAALEKQVAHKFGGLEKQLDAKMREIDGAALAFQQKLNTLWEEYRGLYDQAEAAGEQAAAVAAQQHAAAVRGMEELREGLRAKAAALQSKIERGSRKAGKMPELAQMLAPFLGQD